MLVEAQEAWETVHAGHLASSMEVRMGDADETGPEEPGPPTPLFWVLLGLLLALLAWLVDTLAEWWW
jgi:hypothetical protein